VALTPDEFYEHAIATADADLRLPLSRMTEWDISPFEQDGLRVSPLRAPVVPEPPRHGEDPAECTSCSRRDQGLWLDEKWRLTKFDGVGVPLVLMLHPRDHYDLADLPDDLAAELGVLATHITRHVQAVPHIGNAHVYRFGDGGAHLHVWFFARPEGQRQLLGSWLVVWDDLLPEYPAAVADADAEAVVDALIASYGGSRPVPA
jgi:diadenosine tetraphosphate (Ap4A) HIT family hydrolase